jgi:IclR family pca regulon transcriptional regulator
VTAPDGGPAEPERGGDHVQSLVRGLAVIRSFSADRPEMTLSEVARETGLTRAAARRFLLTLADIGYVRTDGRQFSLTPRVLELGYAYLSGAGLPEVAAPHLHWLVEQVEESASASVLDGDDVVYVARVPTRRIMSVGISIGTRFPAVLTSMGRVLLAAAPADVRDGILGRATWEARTPFTVTDPAALRTELAAVRRRGWALVDQELEAGLRSVAAPVRRADGTVVAAINVSVSAGSGPVADTEQRVVAPLLEAARRIDADLAATRRP